MYLLCCDLSPFRFHFVTPCNLKHPRTTEKNTRRQFQRGKRREFHFHRRNNNTSASFNSPRVCRVALTIAYDYTTPRDGPKTESRRPDKRS